jgi:hypothetical protein
MEGKVGQIVFAKRTNAPGQREYLFLDGGSTLIIMCRGFEHADALCFVHSLDTSE